MAKRERITNYKVQRPIDYDEKAIQKCIDEHGYVLAQVKHDGIRGLLHWDDKRGQYILVTRENIEIVALTERLKLVQRFTRDHEVYDCEVVVPGVPFEVASGLLRRLQPLSSEYTADLYAFDILGLLEGYEERVDQIQINLNAAPALHVRKVFAYKAQSLAKLQELFEAVRVQGYEGLVIKNPRQNYTPNKVQGQWKMKPSETVDGTVIGFVMGTEGKANEGLVVGFKVRLEDGTECHATGFTQPFMREVTANPGNFINRYVEVERMEATSSGNTRHGHFSRLRDLEGAEGIKA